MKNLTLRWTVILGTILSINYFAQAKTTNGSQLFEDDIKITCRTLGKINECENTSLCKEVSFKSGVCLPINPSNDIAVGVCKNGSIYSCESAYSNFCKWVEDEAVRCLPR